MSVKAYIKFLAVVVILIGLSAVWGGYGLISTNGIGMPVSWLDGSPFTSYLIPGLILLFIVGGTNILAGILLWKGSRYASESLATAGFGLLIWIFTEMYIIAHPHWLQALYFGLSLWLLISIMVILKIQKGTYV